ncbi:MAG: hypothetical protein QXP56_07010 [Archaeoglobaceae archaeon]
MRIMGVGKMEEKIEFIKVKCDACGKVVEIQKSFKEQYTDEDWVYGAKICGNCQSKRDLSCYFSFGNPVICLPDELIFCGGEKKWK